MLGLEVPVHRSVCFATGVLHVILRVLLVVRSPDDSGVTAFASATVCLLAGVSFDLCHASHTGQWPRQLVLSHYSVFYILSKVIYIFF